jgi:hypothetical protein
MFDDKLTLVASVYASITPRPATSLTAREDASFTAG